MKVGILGSGDVGRALAKGFSKKGYTAKIGSNHPEKLTEWLKENSNITAGTFSEASSFGEIIVIAVKGEVVKEVVESADLKNFIDKVVIDVTNPLDFSKGMPPGLLVGFDNSGGETVQKLLPGAKVVKTLNIVGNPSMVDPKFEEGTPVMFLCGNDEDAKKTVIKILIEFGWKDITDLGAIEQSRLMEPLCILWVLYGAKNNSWNHAFAVLKK